MAQLRDDLLNYVFGDTSRLRSVSSVDAQSAAENELQKFWDLWDPPYGHVEAYFRYLEAHEGARPARGQETRPLTEFVAMQAMSLEIQHELPDLLDHVGEVLGELLNLIGDGHASDANSPPPE